MISLFRAFLLAVVCAVGGIAHADISPSLGCAVPPNEGTGARNVWDHQGDASAGCRGNYNGNFIVVNGIDDSGPSCVLSYTCSIKGGSYSTSYSKRSLCPSNSTLVGGFCICNAGFDEQDGQCVPPSPCDGLENFCTGLKGPASSFTYSGKVVVPDTLCYPINDYGSCNKGCSASASGMSVTYVNSDGVLVTSTKLNFPGGTCDGPALPQEKPEPKPHECVGDYGVVNGVSTCIPVKEATGDTQKTETINPDGSKSESTTETTCKDGKCTTTETKTNTDAGGNSSSGGSTTTTQGQGEYCKKNPASKVCDAVNGKPGSGEGEGEEGEEGKGSFGGSCGSWQCDGDAIACAIAKRQHDDSCKLLDESNLDGTFSGAVDGSDGKNTDAMKSGATEIGISSFNQSGFGWGSSCPADPSISLEFVEASFEIPFSRICGPLSVLSLAGLGITLLGCLVWVLGGRKQ